jgi:hypothetical protein
VRLMLPCVAFACQRLATAPADTHMAHMSWSWAEMVMERVTQGRVKKVQVRLQRRACCAVCCVFSLVVPVLAYAVCLTRAAGNAGRFSGPLLRIATPPTTPQCSKCKCAFSLLVHRLLLPTAFEASCEYCSRCSVLNAPQANPTSCAPPNAATLRLFGTTWPRTLLALAA